MKYKITIEQGEDYEVTKRVYECDNGEQYDSTYCIPDKNKYTEKYHKTGEINTKYHEVYSQEVEMADIKDVIKAANGFLYDNGKVYLNDSPYANN